MKDMLLLGYKYFKFFKECVKELICCSPLLYCLSVTSSVKTTYSLGLSTPKFCIQGHHLPVILYSNAFGLHAEYAKESLSKKLTFAKTV